MKIYYISPSTIPSRSANSIHVVNMAEALTQHDFKVSLFFHSYSNNLSFSHEEISNHYGVSNTNINEIIYHNSSNKGAELGIAIKAFFCFFQDLLRQDSPKYIISRNLFAAFFFAFFLRRPIIYETHTPEKNFRKLIQGFLISSKNVQTVVISHALKKIISEMYEKQSGKINVFHDAAREGRLTIDKVQRKKLQKVSFAASFKKHNYDKVIGYFGHLYPGRGIEIIESLANINLKHLFIVYGGNEQEIFDYQNRNSSTNLIFMGYASPKTVFDSMRMMDILLMPYQQKVSIGLRNVDTSRWMSPMKMFEYMSVGIPIISSNLPVLMEVLKNEENCLLVEPNVVEEWSAAIKRLSDSSELYDRLGINAYQDYVSKYTWKQRVKGILNLEKQQYQNT
jgi:glycosyltransferase involved in cell wall biosynthesis